MSKPTYDEPDILYVHEGMVRFEKDAEPEMALIMRSERKMSAWISEMNRQLGEANVKRETLPLGRTGWAVPFTLEEDARAIAQKHFAEIVSERPSIVGAREEPKAITKKTGQEVIYAVCAEVIEASCANTPQVVLSYKSETSFGEIHFSMSKEGAGRCAQYLGKTVEVVIVRREE